MRLAQYARAIPAPREAGFRDAMIERRCINPWSAGTWPNVNRKSAKRPLSPDERFRDVADATQHVGGTVVEFLGASRREVDAKKLVGKRDAARTAGAAYRNLEGATLCLRGHRHDQGKAGCGAVSGGGEHDRGMAISRFAACVGAEIDPRDVAGIRRIHESPSDRFAPFGRVIPGPLPGFTAMFLRIEL